MSRFPFYAALCLAALPALAQAQTAPAQPAPATPPAAEQGPPSAAVAAIQQAGVAFGTCVQTGARNVPATVTPEAGATSVLAGCATQRQALDRAAEALVAAMPEAQRAAVQAQIASQLSGVEAQVAAGIRQGRAAAATPAATPAPAPAQ
jgi:hypothetical protein